MDVTSTRSNAVESKSALKRSSGALWKKVMAFTVVAIMVAGAFVILAPTLAQNHAKAAPSGPQEKKASMSLGGAREVTWTYSEFGQSYRKSTDYSQFGHDSSTDGVNQWWYSRANTTGYGDLVVRATYPDIVMNSPYGSAVAWKPLTAGTEAGYFLMSFYKEDVVAKNITTVATGVGKTPIFVPVLNATNGLNMDGGFLNWSYFCQYTTQKETDDIYNGTHFANTYYGVPKNAIDTRPTAGSYANDGYWYQIYGTVDFNASAAQKFLGLTGGKGDLRTQFTTANAAGALNAAWMAAWNKDGSSTGTMDIYTAYEFPLDAYNWWTYLTVDPTSTANHLVLRMWSIGWGLDCLMNRYLDVAGIMSQQNTYAEDCYINGTAISGYGMIVADMRESYHLSAWSDPVGNSAAWMLAPWHIDYDPNNPQNPASSWLSRYAPYNGIKTQNGPRTYDYSPGTIAYGLPVLYWNPLNNWNLSAGEKIVVKLGNRPMLGITPYRGTSDTYFDSPGVPNAAKMAELQSHFVWGELTMGNGFPTGSGLKQYYNGATKTLTIAGPKNFPQNKNTLDGTAWTRLNLTASPNFIFDVSRVSDYSLAMVEAGPYTTGVAYHMTITAKNFTGTTVTDWNGTVNLTASAGTTLGASSMWFGPGSNGVLTATVTFTTSGAQTITVTDRNNSLDVYHTLPVMVGPFSLPLTVGWNFVSVPLVGGGYKASTIGLATGDEIVSWNPATQAYDHVYIKGVSPPVADFSIAPNLGYWVWVASAKTLTLSGSIPTTVQTYTFTVPSTGGWIAIGFESMKTTLHAADIITMYSGVPYTNVTLVAKYTATGYVTYIKGTPLNNFALVPGVGYWCWVEGGGSTASRTLTYTPW